jgi:6-phosphogluconolactonase
MIEAEWWDADDMAELAASAAGDIGFIIESALEARGEAVVALPGDQETLPVLERLAEARLNWRRVTIIPTDDRVAAVDGPLSKVKEIARVFLPKGARVVPIGSDNADYRAAGRAADARLQDLHWPPDLVCLSVGEDGHTAGIFPGPDLDEALAGPKARRALGVMPDPLPVAAPIPTVTLSLASIVGARTLMVILRGQAGRTMLEKALADGPMSQAPIGRVLAEAQTPADIHWCAE